MLADHRGPHYTVLSAAVGTEKLDDLAEILHTELVVIGADTARRRFSQEIRWSQAYHRLTGGG